MKLKLILIMALLSITGVCADKSVPHLTIKDGCFAEKGKLIFSLGPWSALSYPEKLIDRRGPWSQHRMYHDAPDRKMLEEVGFNCVQMNHFMTFPTMKKYYPELLKKRNKWYGVNYFPNAESLCKGVLRRMDGLPIVVDWGDLGTSLGFGKRAHKVLKDKRYFQQTAWWTGFMALDPSYPPAMKLYKSIYQDSVKFLLKNQANPMLYELLNEPFYNSFSPDNMRMFRQFLKKKYQAVHHLNTRYNTKWQSFDEAISKVEKEQDANPGLWVDWMEFSNKLMSGYLKTFKKYVLEVDKRPVQKYFCFQPQLNISEMAYNSSFGMLYHDFLDVIGVEYCGLNFGSHNIGEQKLSDMMEAGFKTSTGKVLTALGIAKAYAQGRPIIDLEMSCARYSNGLRIPSKVGDIETALWHQLMNDVSGSMLYNFSGRSWEWSNMETAKKSARSAHYKSHMLLNPFNYPPEALQDFNKFQTKVGQMRELLLPAPRVRGEIGILYLSRQTWLSKGNEWQNYATYVRSLNSIQVSYDFVVGEQLKSTADLKRFPVILCPQIKYCSEQIKKLLIDYVKNGGVLVVAPQAFSHNDYAQPVNASNVSGVVAAKTKPVPGKLFYREKTLPAKYIKAVSLKLTGAKRFMSWNDKSVAVAVKSQGRGRIYTLGFNRGENGLGVFLALLLKTEKFQPANALNLKFAPEYKTNVTINMISRGGKRFYFLLNWNQSSDLGTLMPNDIKKGKYYVYDPISWKHLKSPKGKSQWNAAELRQGIPVFLPKELRSLILITPEKSPYDKGNVSIAQISKVAAKQFKIDMVAVQKEQRIAARQIQKLFANRMFNQILPDKVFKIDLRPYVTTSFSDNISNDGKGGWTDQGQMNDLSAIPLGAVNFYGVPYKIINPDTNKGKSCIVLKGTKRADFPAQVTGIKIHKKAVSLYFLHTMGWSSNHVMDYVIHYGDNSKLVIPVRRKYEIDGWWKPADANLESPNLKLAWTGKNKRSVKIGIYTFRWENPYPGKVIKSIDIISAKQSVPGIIAITGAIVEKKVAEPKEKIVILSGKIRQRTAVIAFRMEKPVISRKNGLAVYSFATQAKQKWGGITIKLKSPVNLKKGKWQLSFDLNYCSKDDFGRPAVSKPLQVFMNVKNKPTRIKKDTVILDALPESRQRFKIPFNGPEICERITFQFKGQNPDFGSLEISNICFERIE
jgi:Beta-galactosidase/Beta-galactosidase trimerisation domain